MNAWGANKNEIQCPLCKGGPTRGTRRGYLFEQGQEGPLKAAPLSTPLGPMVAIADEAALYLLEFTDRREIKREIERLQQKTKSAIAPGNTAPLQFIKNELKAYFEGQLTEFQTPFYLLGSPFQKQVWEALQKIPAGETRSYLDLAKAIGKPTAFRAVAQANASNSLAIVIPCHRIINANGGLGGYAGGLHRKKWLLQHEKQMDPKRFDF